MESHQSINSGNDKKDVIKLSILTFLILLFLVALGSGCKEKDCPNQLIQYSEPVFVSLDKIRVTASFERAREIEQPGKIYYKDGYIFINEIDSGIHVIDNRVLSNPRPIGFIKLPGNKDLAARGNYMYADSYMDLVVLDISNKHQIFESSRVEDVFDNYYYHYADMGVLVDYVVREEEVEVDCDTEIMIDTWGLFDGGGIANDALFSRAESASNVTTGIGGSLARFTITDDYLYTINDWRMKLFDITDLANPSEGNTVDLGWGIETIFPYGDKLFLGARNGMHIYDNSNPELPEFISTYSHINTCDPVVVQDDYAYVTLRSGNTCENFTNQLDVIDIKDVNNPKLVETYPMENPHGLGINGTCLFIAEGDFGLKVFNATDVLKIDQNLIAHHKDVHALDVIPLNDVLFMIGNDGLHQYSYDCGQKFQYLSTISF
ncbi:MAG: hypothetical protein JXQ96_12440 [Cyclobacteriaceae bacterium]